MTCPPGRADAVQNFDRGDKKWKPKEIGPVIDQIAQKTVLGTHAACVVTMPEKNVSAAKIVTMSGVTTRKTEQKIYKTPHRRIEIMKITGIKKAVSEIKRNPHMHHIVYFDRSTGKVWADFYADGNSWTQYRDAAIVNLRNYIIPEDIDRTLTAIYTNAAKRAMEEYND